LGKVDLRQLHTEAEAHPDHRSAIWETLASRQLMRRGHTPVAHTRNVLGEIA
jgi:hypothetical protein